MDWQGVVAIGNQDEKIIKDQVTSECKYSESLYKLGLIA
jgi:hypothetical protein